MGIERDKSPENPEVVRNMSWFVLLEDRMFGNTVRFPVYYYSETGEYLEPDEKTLKEYYRAIGEDVEDDGDELTDEIDEAEFQE